MIDSVIRPGVEAPRNMVLVGHQDGSVLVLGVKTGYDACEYVELSREGSLMLNDPARGSFSPLRDIAWGTDSHADEGDDTFTTRLIGQRLLVIGLY